MTKQKKRERTNAFSVSRRFLSLMVAVIVAIVALAAISVVARQAVGRRALSSTQTSVEVKSVKKYVTVKVAGREVQVDPQTGQIKPLSAQEAKVLADGLKVVLNRSTEGLVEVQHEDGSKSMDLQGRFQNVEVARINEDGTLSQSCVDNAQAAASFFGIDPQLLGAEPSASAPARKPARVAPVKTIQ